MIYRLNHKFNAFMINEALESDINNLRRIRISLKKPFLNDKIIFF